MYVQVIKELFQLVLLPKVCHPNATYFPKNLRLAVDRSHGIENYITAALIVHSTNVLIQSMIIKTIVKIVKKYIQECSLSKNPPIPPLPLCPDSSLTPSALQKSTRN